MGGDIGLGEMIAEIFRRRASDLDARVLLFWIEMIAEILSRSNSPRRFAPAELAL